MPLQSRVVSAILLSALALGAAGCAGLPKELQGRCPQANSLGFMLYGADEPLPPDAGRQPGTCRVKSITLLADGTRPDWSPDGRRIAFDREVSGTYEVFVMNADGSHERCLTREGSLPRELEHKHKGKATFVPGRPYLLFGAENEHGRHGLTTTPGIGDNHDLWLRSLDEPAYWRLTRYPKDYAVQYPRFSADGRRLLWSVRYVPGKPRRRGCEFGLWKILLADLVFGPAGPQLANVRELKPGGDGFYEPHGFDPGGRTIIFTAALEPGQSQIYGDIYTYDLDAGRLTRLTRTPSIHEEQALFSPDGSKIAFMSGPFIGVSRLAYKTEIYLMDSDGGNRVRLTRFNEPDSPESTGSTTLIDKIAWRPCGGALVSAYHAAGKKLNKIFRLEFTGPCGGSGCE